MSRSNSQGFFLPVLDFQGKLRFMPLHWLNMHHPTLCSWTLGTGDLLQELSNSHPITNTLPLFSRWISVFKLSVGFCDDWLGAASTLLHSGKIINTILRDGTSIYLHFLLLHVWAGPKQQTMWYRERAVSNGASGANGMFPGSRTFFRGHLVAKTRFSAKKCLCAKSCAHTIHETGIFTYIYHKSQAFMWVNIGFVPWILRVLNKNITTRLALWDQLVTLFPTFASIIPLLSLYLASQIMTLILASIMYYN